MTVAPRIIRERVLPLRRDLQLLPGPRQPDGSPAWNVYDPLRNRFFQIGRLAFEMLRRWHLEDVMLIAASIERETPFCATSEDVSRLSHFLGVNNLLRGDAMGAALYSRQAAAMKESLWQWLLHNYLFFRVPVLKPAAILETLWPLVRHVYRRETLWILAALAILGGYLIMRQWDAFIGTLPAMFSWQGACSFALALAILKISHEFGHAFTAYRYGCRIATMGVAFMVLWPLLYTDTTDAWRLVSRHQRLAIGIAGVATELALAIIAACLWGILPDGPVRSAMFLVVASAAVTSVAVNLNPLMRFDAYYMFSDWLGVQNLQQRAFALGRWRLREAVFGANLPPPENLSSRNRGILIAYAFACALYRLVVFTGIAVVVYHYFFKALGIVLFVTEIGWFVVRPVVDELKVWPQLSQGVASSRRLSSLVCVIAIGVIYLVMPSNTRIAVPAVLAAEKSVRVYAPVPARIDQVYVRRGATVRAGDPLLRLISPDLDESIDKTRLEIESLETELKRAGIEGQELPLLRVVREKLAAAKTELGGLAEQQSRLTVTSPIDGVVVEWADALRAGRWIDTKLVLALVQDPGAVEVRALLPEDRVGDVEEGAHAVFIPDDLFRRPVSLTVTHRSSAPARVMDDRALASVFEGPVPASKNAHGQFVPEGTLYPVTLVPRAPVVTGFQQARGVVVIEAPARSSVLAVLRMVGALFVRESGF